MSYTFLAVGHHTDGTHNEAGLTRQVVNTQTGAVATCATSIPYDDTIPQKTEGDEVMTLAITPKSATNKLLIEVTVFCSTNAAGLSQIVAALFQDATAGALACGFVGDTTGAVECRHISFSHYMTSGTTSETTFKVRLGSNANTVTFNGVSTARKYGGVFASSITIREIQV